MTKDTRGGGWVRQSSTNPPWVQSTAIHSLYLWLGINGYMRQSRKIPTIIARVNSFSYEYTGGDGELYRTNWYADETGYHAEAEHLPRNRRI